MVKRTEDRIEKDIEQYVCERGGIAYHQNIKGRQGLSDLVACYKGYFIAIEVKRPGRSHVRVQQKLYADEVSDAGGIAMITDSLDFVAQVLDIIDNGTEDTLDGTPFKYCGGDARPVIYDISQPKGVWSDILDQFKK